MNSLRDAILADLVPVARPVRLVSDPDDMLLDTVLLEAIRELGYELITFDDPITFRFSLERNLRGNPADESYGPLPVLARWPFVDLERAPFDLISAGNPAEFSLSRFFPDLSYAAVSALEPADLETLYAAQEAYPPGRIGETATKEYILRHVFEIAVELIKEPGDLFQVLLKRHYAGDRVPSVLDGQLISQLRRNPAFNEWPLELIVPNRDAFFMFVQERWPVFLDRQMIKAAGAIGELPAKYGFRLPGVAELPFDDANVRVYIDNLFIEGFLGPVSYSSDHLEGAGWARVGIAASPREDRASRIKRLMESIDASVPDTHDRYEQWTAFALLWARLTETLSGSPEDEVMEAAGKLPSLSLEIDGAFSDWLIEHYGSLIQLPASPPVMLHHIPRFLARVLSSDSGLKVAFLLIDGLALDQWLTLKNVLRGQDPGLIFKDSQLFAWIPTVTSVSRQAVFSGKIPSYFPSSINTTNKEKALWGEYWAGEGMEGYQVLYERGLSDGDVNVLADQLSDPRIRVAGLIVDKVDKIMHGMQLGTPGMHNQIKQWARGGFLHRLISSLMNLGFYVYLSSDHGNIEAKGIGNPREGAVAETRGSRVRVYPDQLLRQQVAGSYPEALEWPSTGLPPDYLPLIAPNRKAFVNETETIIGHGGSTLEEVIVPFVSISRSVNGSK